MKELSANIKELKKLTGYTAYHSQGFMGEGMTVAVLDTGIRKTHKEFITKNILQGKNFVTSKNYDENDYVDDNGHGTSVASCISGQSVGVAPKCKILPIKVACNESLFYPDEMVNALKYVRDYRTPEGKTVNAINISTGFANDWKGMHEIIKELLAMDILIFTSSGNTGYNDWYRYPDRYAETITVGAIDYERKLASFSAWSENVDICQLGVNIGVASHWDDDEYWFKSGTSFSAPISAGLAVLIAEKYEKTKGKRISADVWKELIEFNTKDLGNLGYDEYHGYGFFTLQPLISDKIFKKNSSVMIKNGKEIIMDAPAEIKKGRFQVPLRKANDDTCVIWIPETEEAKIYF